jgi:hypothetical protein
MRFAYYASFFFRGRPAFRALSCLGCAVVPILISIGCRRAIDPKVAAIRTESIHISLHRAARFIDSARDLLVAKDPGGDSDHVASALLIHTALGDSLQSAVRNLMTVCHDSWPTPATIINIDNAFHFTKQLLAPGAWDQVYFTDTPTATAYTLLSSMEDECKGAVNFAVSTIDGPLH